MGGIREQAVRHGQAFPPDPLRDAALVLLEHPVQVSKRHGQVACNGLGIEFGVWQMVGDELLCPQQTKGSGGVAPCGGLRGRVQQQLQVRADLIVHRRGKLSQGVLDEAEDPVPKRLDEQPPGAKTAIDPERR